MFRIGMLIGDTKMKINVYAMMNLDHQVKRANSFCRGLARHGCKAKVLPHNTPQVADLAVFWGMHHSVRIRHQQEQATQPWLMMERGYVGDRFYFTSLGYNGLNGHADFLNKNSPPDRWNKHFSGWLKPWHMGDYIYVTGQVHGDASIKNIRVNYQNLINQLKSKTNRPIIFRPHPQNRGSERIEGVSSIDKKGKLQEMMAKAHCVVTYNSNTSVDAILAGTPCITLAHGSMVEGLSSTSLDDVNTPPRPDRETWANDIAYAQWTPEEIENGETWEHLKKKFEA